MTAFVRRWVRKFLAPTAPVTTRQFRTRLGCDVLEAREVPAVALLNGVLTITGTAGADTVYIDRLTTPAGSYTYRVTENAVVTANLPAASITAGRISFTGGAGNDRMHNNSSLDMWADGGAGNDTLYPGWASDTVYGGDGDDYIHASGGDNVVYGGAGNDTLAAWGGNDTFYGGTGNDTITGDAGNDRIYGEAGNDILNGGIGADSLYGQDGDDTLNGDADADYLSGGLGVDRMSGGDGNDTMYGNDGNDNMTGGAGHDWLYGGAGNDWMDGMLGNDIVSGEAGNDTVYGQDGDDWVYGGDGDDNVHGEAGSDVVYGGAGNDNLSGGAGIDTLYGEAGIDTLTDTTGTNTLNGGGGNDIINGVSEIQAALNRKGLSSADTSALSAAVVAAIRGPEARFLQFEGHSFHVKPVQRVFDPAGVTYSGRISHHLSDRPDDQVDYRVRVENGQIVFLDWRIADGGFSALVKPAFSVAVSVAGVNLPFFQRVVAENVAEQVVDRIENYLAGPWQNAARFMIEDIAAALRDQAATDIALNRVGGTTAHMGALQQLVIGATTGPRAEFQNVFGHTFHAGPMSATPVIPGVVRYNGQLSHHLGWWLPDDQVYYSFEVANGQVRNLDFRINQGGFTALVPAAIQVIDAVIGVPMVGLVTFAAEELVGRIQTVADGSWESVARLIVTEIAAARARM